MRAACSPMERRLSILASLCLLLAVSGCASEPTPTPPSPTPTTSTLGLSTLAPAVAERIDRAIEMRSARGMRADRVWVEMLELDPSAARAWGVRIRPGEDAIVTDENLRWSITTRHALGYREDEAWVRSVIVHPASVLRMSRLLLMPDEAREYDGALSSALNYAPVLAQYAKDHPDEWAGWYVDGGDITVLVTRDLDQHKARIEALFALALEVTVKKARWSQADLRGLMRTRIAQSDLIEWLDGRGIEVEGYGLRTAENRVGIDVTTERTDIDEEAVKAMIAAHLGDDGHGAAWIQILVEFVPPAPDLAKGALVVSVVDPGGRPVVEGDVQLTPDVPRANGSLITDCLLETTVELQPGVCRWPRIAATGYDVTVWRTYLEDSMGSGRVVVAPDGETRLTIVVTADR